MKPSRARVRALATVSWLWVGLPFVYGVCELVEKIPALFTR
ncbi:MFS transporter small subunit [Mycobacterium parmense]|nr:hypothetical protein [Mycobacterium parmense]